MMPIRHLVIIGTGLIGGSVALALKQQGMVERVTGVGRQLDNLLQAVDLNIIDDYSQNIGDAVRDADMVLIAVPVAAYTQVFSELYPDLPQGAWVTDAGSTKQSVIHAARQQGMDMTRFVPAHPIAGTEQSGASAAFASLFQDKRCILTPLEETDSDAIQAVRAMWQHTGATVELMAANEHDAIMASISHLPHFTAFALMNALPEQEALRFAAGGFRDITRIASSSPDMWRDIGLCNVDAIVHNIDALQAELDVLKQALLNKDGALLLQKFQAAKQTRDQWLIEHGESI